MGTAYIGNRAYFLDEQTDTLWESEQKRTQFDRNTGLPMEAKKPVEKAPEPVVEAVFEAPAEPEAPVVEVDPLKCHCGYVAKSKAGLAVHKLSHRVH